MDLRLVIESSNIYLDIMGHTFRKNKQSYNDGFDSKKYQFDKRTRKSNRIDLYSEEEEDNYYYKRNKNY